MEQNSEYVKSSAPTSLRALLQRLTFAGFM